MLGDEHVNRVIAGTTPFTAPLQDLITRYAWGEIWSRPGLSRAERSLVTLTALAVLRQDAELALHVKAALRSGLTIEQIQEAASPPLITRSRSPRRPCPPVLRRTHRCSRSGLVDIVSVNGGEEGGCGWRGPG